MIQTIWSWGQIPMMTHGRKCLRACRPESGLPGKGNGQGGQGPRKATAPPCRVPPGTGGDSCVAGGRACPASALAQPPRGSVGL